MILILMQKAMLHTKITLIKGLHVQKYVLLVLYYMAEGKIYLNLLMTVLINQKKKAKTNTMKIQLEANLFLVKKFTVEQASL